MDVAFKALFGFRESGTCVVAELPQVITLEQNSVLRGVY